MTKLWLLLIVAAASRVLAQQASRAHTILSKNEEIAFFHSCSGGEVDTVRRMLKEHKGLAHATTEEGESCLHLVAISGNLEIAQALVDSFADLNARTTFDGGLRMHVLSWHVYAGHHEIVKLLLDHGARINDDFDLSAQSDEKVTALDIAEKLSGGKTDSPNPDKFEITYKLLLERGGKKYRDLHGSDKDEL
eukprot:CAMPEP_0183299186 /NCGR_PEP_ID=MMETSP0160_2-20130417/5987_1 /TAXON_ID=2839 ORGANISM="Odontella Sinensis, Strain Grunow 1884" /NCGR_SAMPLE_ID=MMETSP0160_2 /ASSEMBLY_ACC=CAM_ASM_000250 /LENGTH=191 /DNA_ID=CAMNT_0025461379 /DNA_START=57 /DNA_END=632 /DNA_ORIENTATION=+